MDQPPADYILLLNRNETIIPAVVKLNRDQICAYFMLGETKGTSAGGAAEAGKNLRVPGTNPFFFTNDALQGNSTPCPISRCTSCRPVALAAAWMSRGRRR